MSRDPQKQPIPPFNYTQGQFALAQAITSIFATPIAKIIDGLKSTNTTSTKWSNIENLITPLINHVKYQLLCHTNWTVKHGVIIDITSSISRSEANKPLTLQSSYQTPLETTQADSIKAMLLDSAISSLADGSFKNTQPAPEHKSVIETTSDQDINELQKILKTHRDEILKHPDASTQLTIMTEITKHSFSEGGFSVFLKDSYRTRSSNSLSINGVNAKTASNILFFLKGPSNNTKWILFGIFCDHGFDAFCEGLRETFETLKPAQQPAFLQSINKTSNSVVPEEYREQLPQELSIDVVITAAKTAHKINCKTDFSKLLPQQGDTVEISDATLDRDIALFIRNIPLKKIITRITSNLSILGRDKDRFTNEVLGLKKPLTALKNKITSAMEADSLPRTVEAYQEEFNTIMSNELIYNKQKPLKKDVKHQKAVIKPSKHRPLYIALASISLAVGATATPCIAVLLPPLFAHSVATSIYTVAALLAVVTVGVAVLFAVLAGKKNPERVKRITDQPAKKEVGHGKSNGAGGRKIV